MEVGWRRTEVSRRAPLGGRQIESDDYAARWPPPEASNCRPTAPARVRTRAPFKWPDGQIAAVREKERNLLNWTSAMN